MNFCMYMVFYNFFGLYMGVGMSSKYFLIVMWVCIRVGWLYKSYKK